ncbi:hypothetical protein FDB40_17215 [Clostridium botulinum]|nr:hypothetical protein [Clostridium botulinum]
MTLISIRKRLFREIRLKELATVSDYEFRYIYTYQKFNEMLKEIGITEKIIGQYNRAIDEFFVFLDLINININDVLESDLELYRELLLRRNNNKRSAKTKITRIKAYLYTYSKINEHESMQGDLSSSGILKGVKQIISE